MLSRSVRIELPPTLRSSREAPLCFTCFPLRPSTSENDVQKLSEKSLRCPKRVPTRLPNRPVRPFRPRYTGQMHLRSVTRTPFQTVSRRSSGACHGQTLDPTKLHFPVTVFCQKGTESQPGRPAFAGPPPTTRLVRPRSPCPPTPTPLVPRS